MDLYRDHLHHLQHQLKVFLHTEKKEALLLGSGIPQFFYDDDIERPHRTPASIAHWIPEPIGTCQFLLLKDEQRILFSYRPDDFWLKVKDDYGPWTDFFTIHIFNDINQLINKLSQHINKKCLWLGPDLPPELAVQPVTLSQKQAIDAWRVIKTDYEIKNLFAASCLAAKAHVALKESFNEGVSEFEAHLDYLDVLGYTEHDLPYGNIVAFNEHASILHYQDLERLPPDQFYSFLLDAGARYAGYIADISRTHAGEDANDQFCALLSDLRRIKMALIAESVQGLSYIDIHQSALTMISEVLVGHNLIYCTPEEAMEKKLTQVFFPHGIGHLLGLNTHDTSSIAKQLLNDRNCPFENLRLTHQLKNHMVLTIEPGIYFNKVLMNQALTNPMHAPLLNKQLIAQFMPYGGIRDEDNIVITDNTPRNLTAEAFCIIGCEGF